jgi:hypothetical protein
VVECVCKPGYIQRLLAEVITTVLDTTPTSTAQISPTNPPVPTSTPAPVAPILTFYYREDESPYSWQEAYDEAQANGRRLPTISGMRAYISDNPTFFSTTFPNEQWTPVVNPAVTGGKDALLVFMQLLWFLAEHPISRLMVIIRRGEMAILGL